MIVDCHAHLTPPSCLDEMRKAAPKVPSVRLIEQDGSLAFSFAGNKPTRAVAKGLSDIPGRLAWMDKNGIDYQVCGGWVDSFGYEIPAAEGEIWSRVINDTLMETARSQKRIVPLASVPMQDGALAGRMLREAMDQGFPGVMISTLPHGIGSVLDAPDLDPFWKAADDTGAVVHIHPSFDAGDSRVHDYGLPNGIGRVSDAIVAVSRLLMSGHVIRYRNAKIFVPIGASGLPFAVGRLMQTHSITPGTADPSEGLALLYTDTVVHDPRVLRFVVDMMGADRLMMGSDMPFPIGDLEPMTIVGQAGLGADQVAMINGGLAQRLFKIE